jgi:hypothetical protein
MLQPEVLSYPSNLTRLQHSLIRWPQTRARIKNVFNLAREEEACINSRKLI